MLIYLLFYGPVMDGFNHCDQLLHVFLSFSGSKQLDEEQFILFGQAHIILVKVLLLLSLQLLFHFLDGELGLFHQVFFRLSWFFSCIAI